MLLILLSLSLSGAPKVDSKLVGTWNMADAPFITLNANGTGNMEDGKLKWSADGSTLVVTDEEGTADKVQYQLQGDSLVMTMGGIPLTLTRAGAGGTVKKQGLLAAKAAKASKVSEEQADREALAEAQAYLQKNGQPGQPAQPGQVGNGKATPPPDAPHGAAADQLSQLLLSSAWCSFHYNKISGSSSTEKYRFFPNGTWNNGGRTETYNSGYAGTVAGQYDSANGGRWEVRAGVLYMSTPGNPVLSPVNGTVTRNSNGYPIINANGKEYSSCN